MFERWRDLFAALGSLIMLPSLAQHTVIPQSLSPKRLYNVLVTPSPEEEQTMDDFIAEARQLLESPLTHDALLDMSARMRDAYKQKLLDPAAACMLPSYNHTLPSGEERGTYLALDVGGSTFRVALVELRGKDRGDECMEIVRMLSYKIDEPIRGLKGRAFFDWMAERIQLTLEDPVVKAHHGAQTLPMGLAWSFPIK
jgi:hexokinase